MIHGITQFKKLTKIKELRKRVIVSILVLAVVAESSGALVAWAADNEPAYEVWIIDQSNTTVDGGGTLYIYQGDTLAGKDAATAVPEVIDLGGTARDLCLEQTGTAPKRPHMLDFNAEQSHAIISFAATGHVLFMDTDTRTPISCIDAGEEAHAAVPSPDQTYVVVTNHDHLERINTDYANNAFTLDASAMLNLGEDCTTPNGSPCMDPELRPNNVLICSVVDSTNRFTFATLRGGGMFVVNSAATPMAIVAEYDKNTIHPNGCGAVETAGKIYVNSGGGTAANPLESDLYVFKLSDFSSSPNPPNTPAPGLIFSHDAQGFVDSHGMVLTKKDRFLWVGDRAANRMIVVDTVDDVVISEFSLVSAMSSDPAPDLMDISPSGNRVFVSLRGPNPLSGNAPIVNNAVGNTPGLGVIRLKQNGKMGVMQSIAAITHIVDGVERADPHAVRVRLK